MIKFETSHGTFTVELFPKEAPVTVENFLQYVDDGHFDGTIFHRIVPGFVIQGGGLTADFANKKTRAPITNEAKNGLKNTRGALSMARTSDINSATSQFFVNLDRQRLPRPRPARLRLRGVRPRHRGHGRDRQHRGGEHRPPQGLPGRAARGRGHRVRAARAALVIPRPAWRHRAPLPRGCCGGSGPRCSAWLVLTAVPVLLLRWLHPLTSAFMLEAQLEAWRDQRPRLQHRLPVGEPRADLARTPPSR